MNHLVCLQTAFGGDGAPAISGLNIGVTGRILKIVPSLLYFHCVAHCNQLGAKELCDTKRFELLNDVQGMLADTYSWFNASPKRQELKSLYDVYTEDAKLQVLAVHAVRWLGVAKCAERFLELYVVLVHAVEDGVKHDKQGTSRKLSQRLLAALKDPVHLHVLTALSGAMDQLHTTSKVFQKPNLSIEEKVHTIARLKRQVFQLTDRACSKWCAIQTFVESIALCC